jgi:protein-S-isoprenylcysteine O-methyltransferase Ste14
VTRILDLLPIVVLMWIAIVAGAIFSRDVGRRDPRGLGIVVSLWGTLVVANSLGTTPPLSVSAVGVVGLLLALLLFHWAAFSIRGRVFSYAGHDDLPQFVHTAGPYAYVRNPFYASYLLAEISTIAMAPSVWGGLAIAASGAYFQWLARFEEEKFSRSPVAAEYQVYKARTGRLFPKVWS